MSYKGSFYRKSVIILLCKLFNKPVIVHVHGSTFKDFYNGLNPTLKKYVQFILNKTDKLVVLSKEWSDFFSTFVKKEKIFILYNGVEVKEKPVSRIKEVNPVVNCVFLGRLGQRKGIYDLLDSIKILKERNIKTVFHIAGDGEIEKVKSIVKQYGIEDYVKIIGWINDEEREDLLTTSEVLVLPSYNEGLPMAILEAMSYGLTIISTPVGGIPEAVSNGENGYLVNPGDSAALAKAIEKTVTNENWRNQAKKLNRLKISEQFNLADLIKSLEKLYIELSYKKGE
jgi:glycosyltransferase involved in cell wall biosynthesis